MTRRGNIQHGRRRRIPWSTRLPLACLAVLIPITAAMLVVWIQAVAG